MITGNVWLFSINKETRNTVYGAISIIGISISIILVTSLAQIAKLIGKDKQSGAFVYSFMNFLYKISSGLVIFMIQAFKPEATNR